MNMRAPSPWDGEVVDTLKHLWEKESASEIARDLNARFGLALTRNSVIGKLHRMGLTVSNKTEVHPNTRGIRRQKKEKIHTPIVKFVRKNGYTTLLRAIETTASELPSFDCIEEPPLNKTIDELTPSDCRYIGDDATNGARYCGHRIHKYSFCLAHFLRCYHRPVPKIGRAA